MHAVQADTGVFQHINEAGIAPDKCRDEVNDVASTA